MIFLKAKRKLREAEYKTDLESDDADIAKKFRKIKAAKINSDSDDSTFETPKKITSLQIPCAPPRLQHCNFFLCMKYYAIFY